MMTRAAGSALVRVPRRWERTVILEPPLSTGAGGGSPDSLAWHGGQIIQASGRGPGCSEVVNDKPLRHGELT